MNDECMLPISPLKQQHHQTLEIMEETSSNQQILARHRSFATFSWSLLLARIFALVAKKLTILG